VSGVIFEWDEAKDLANQKKHDLSFLRASHVFDDPLRVSKVDRIEEGEVRWQTFGMIEGLLTLMVAYTIWDAVSGGERVRIISVRRATKQERWIYENENG
jgi:uncharacterized protein